MKVVYTAPNRAHHYKYAAALNGAGCLHAFISGFPRISPRAQAPELNGKLHRADILQTLYLLTLKARLPKAISNWFAFISKKEQDFACRKYVKDCDVFLFYNGSGLSSIRYGKRRGVINVVEAVNSHVEYQEEILAQEYKKLNLSWTPFPKNEKKRRLKEYDEADYILLPSEFVKRSFISKGFPEEKLLKVPFGFNKISLKESNVTPRKIEDSITILYVGSISVRKGVRYLIEAFNKLQHAKKKLMVVGPDVKDGALNVTDLNDAIIFTGVLKGKELEAAYQSADIFCLPSIEEGLALVLGEALSYGLPIVTTTNTGAEDIIVDGIEGYIVPIRDSDAIVCKFQALADNPDLFEKMRANSCLKATTLNGWEETGRNLVGILKRVYNK